MKRLLLFIAFSLLAEFCMAENGFYGRLTMLFFSFTGVIPMAQMAQAVHGEDIEDDIIKEAGFVGLGLGIDFPLLFMEKKINEWEYKYFMIKPSVAVEYDLFNRLRIQTGLHFGKYKADGFGFTNYYAGLSGLFRHDFGNDVTAGGVSLEIGCELILFIMGVRLQLGYDFYSINRYNGLSFTLAGSFLLFWD